MSIIVKENIKCNWTKSCQIFISQYQNLGKRVVNPICATERTIVNLIRWNTAFEYLPNILEEHLFHKSENSAMRPFHYYLPAYQSTTFLMGTSHQSSQAPLHCPSDTCHIFLNWNNGGRIIFGREKWHTGKFRLYLLEGWCTTKSCRNFISEARVSDLIIWNTYIK